MRQAPERFGVACARWRLADLRRSVGWLAGYSLSGIWQAIKRLGVTRKRGRLSVHSPDPEYEAKVFRVRSVRRAAARHPERVSLLYGDEFSLYREPTLAGMYWPAGSGPVARLPRGSVLRWRVSGAMDAVTGRVVWTSGARMGVDGLVAFLRAVREAYPDRTLCLAWDNWFVHRHRLVLAEAEALRVRILWLPTYAPWTNPIEKLWRWVRQQVVHHHRLSERWDELIARTSAFLDQFNNGSHDLLRYTGLSPV